MHCGDQRHAGLCLGRSPCTSRRRVQGRSQGTTLSASDLHNAGATILNPFYNMVLVYINKKRKKTREKCNAVTSHEWPPPPKNGFHPAAFMNINELIFFWGGAPYGVQQNTLFSTITSLHRQYVQSGVQSSRKFTIYKTLRGLTETPWVSRIIQLE